jgi:hypothetical protein
VTMCHFFKPEVKHTVNIQCRFDSIPWMIHPKDGLHEFPGEEQSVLLNWLPWSSNSGCDLSIEHLGVYALY